MDRSEITVELVRELVARQFPQWADLEIRPLETNGWDNTTFRLGESLSVRLPNGDSYAPQVEKEHRWLPVLGPELPLPIPTPKAKGEPDQVFPRPWSIYGWHEGSPAFAAEIDDETQFALELATFLRALYEIDGEDGPAPGPGNQWRGGPLDLWDGLAGKAMGGCSGEFDPKRILGVWQKAMSQPFTSRPHWVHGDVAASNLLVVGGRLSAVIDFGCSAVGDPACDLAIAYTLFSSQGREAFRSSLSSDSGIDAGAWWRARGWVLWKALAVLQDDIEGNGRYPTWRQMGWRIDARKIIEAVLSEAEQEHS